MVRPSSILVRPVAVAGTALLLGVTGVANAQQDPAAALAPVVVEVTARRFAFEPDRIEVAKGDRVRLVLRSTDGVHGVAIKKLKIEKTIPRGGEPVSIEFTASEAGTFPILCSEYCGKDHDRMKGALVVTVRSPR